MSMMDSVKLLTRGCVSLLSERELADKLSLKRPLRVKLGVDPTAADLHLGHGVVLTKLRAFQDLGHTAVLIFGDFTAAIGDPSGRDSTRPPLAESEIKKNAEAYQRQAFKVLDRSKTELHYNSEWLGPFLGRPLLEALKKVTVPQLLVREDFKTRLKSGAPLTVLESLYPVFQGQDSVAVKADVELGGSDQLTNLLMGRRMQELAGQPPQVAMTFPLLIGLDGVKKMSKSYGNAVGFLDSPRDMFGKLMSLPDKAMESYYELFMDAAWNEARGLHPMEAKKNLAEKITARFHGAEAAAAERAFFERTFSKRERPSDIPSKTFPVGVLISEMVYESGMAPSKNQARRLIVQGAVKINGEKVLGDAELPSERDFVLQVGRRQFAEVRLIESGKSGSAGPPKREEKS